MPEEVFRLYELKNGGVCIEVPGYFDIQEVGAEESPHSFLYFSAKEMNEVAQKLWAFVQEKGLKELMRDGK